MCKFLDSPFLWPWGTSEMKLFVVQCKDLVGREDDLRALDYAPASRLPSLLNPSRERLISTLKCSASRCENKNKKSSSRNWP